MRQIFTYTKVKWAWNPYTGVLMSMPLVSTVADVDIEFLPMAGLEIQFVDPTDTVIISQFEQAMIDAVPDTLNFFTYTTSAPS